ncbi:hypothetical protein DUT91_04620 [Phyllobacterium salinisoli]|uniref:Uncharacterized protein n=1 Tax=Phyllobacterium salinisoli TaxID=1899321 RepID=A0A368K6B6_9HYPH|nr:hypothetical protein [Phyllobacterium salinisoli]RCS24754.1 hypothetical protein DUT91_04620 [Phyllobacterium salinisoli]
MGKKRKAVPKRVGGVKVPKTLRRSRMLRALLGTPLGRNVLANALTAAAAAAAAVLVEERHEIAQTGKKGLKKSGRTMAIAGDAVQSATNAAMEVLAETAQSLLPEEARKGKKLDAGKETVRH